MWEVDGHMRDIRGEASGRADLRLEKGGGDVREVHA